MHACSILHHPFGVVTLKLLAVFWSVSTCVYLIIDRLDSPKWLPPRKAAVSSCRDLPGSQWRKDSQTDILNCFPRLERLLAGYVVYHHISMPVYHSKIYWCCGRNFDKFMSWSVFCFQSCLRATWMWRVFISDYRIPLGISFLKSQRLSPGKLCSLGPNYF